MRIVQFTPGTGNFHCGSCLRDHAMARVLRARGHDVVLVPLYLPLVLDEEDPDEVLAPLFLGGINMYLQQKISLFRHTPAWFDRLLDRETLLRGAAAAAGMTRARDLGEMTVSSLQGKDGRQKKEVQKLIGWLEEQERPDVLSFSNGLLTGVARDIGEALDAPVVCSLQGEDSFIESLPQRYRDESWRLFRENSRGIARYVAVSDYYAGVMRRHLEPDGEKITVVHNGVDLTPFRSSEKAMPPVIGYLARQCMGKGLHTFVDAFLILRQRAKADARLHVAGAETAVDEAFVGEQKEKLRAAGLNGEATFSPNLDQSDKAAFLRSLSVFSVPATYGEAFGLYLLEALASGVPVVQPEHGAFPEILRRSGGGILCRPDDPRHLAECWEELLLDNERRATLAHEGEQGVRAYFHADRMTDDMLRVFEEVQCKERGGSGASSAISGSSPEANAGSIPEGSPRRVVFNPDGLA